MLSATVTGGPPVIGTRWIEKTSVPVDTPTSSAVPSRVQITEPLDPPLKDDGNCRNPLPSTPVTANFTAGSFSKLTNASVRPSGLSAAGRHILGSEMLSVRVPLDTSKISMLSPAPAYSVRPSGETYPWATLPALLLPPRMCPPSDERRFW